MTPAKSHLNENLSRNDPRLKPVLAKIKEENYRPDALIEILHAAQNSFGYLPMNVLAFVAKELKIPPSRVYSTVTFYHLFSLKPKGEHTCSVCTGTACYIKGATRILSLIEKDFSLKSGEVSADNKLGLSTVRCTGTCHLAPLVVMDDEILGRIEPQTVRSRILSKMGAGV